MLVVAGTGLKNLNPRVWDSSSPYHLPQVSAVMISYADFFQNPVQRKKAMESGIRTYLGVPEHVQLYLDNGAFFFLGKMGHVPEHEYNEFVTEAQPDWWPIPQDFIPVSTLADVERRQCFERTMQSNLAYDDSGHTPVIHISPYLHEYTDAVGASPKLAAKPSVALGGIVPNLLRRSKALPYQAILDSLLHVREAFAGKQLHVFGIGGTATLHLASLLGIDSADSSGWRNRAARGIVQLPGSGDRSVANLGSWRGREPSLEEWERLAACACPACQAHGIVGLQATGSAGFCNRATHNLWTLQEEAGEIESHLEDGSYPHWYETHLDNTIYLPLIKKLVDARFMNPHHPKQPQIANVPVPVVAR